MTVPFIVQARALVWCRRALQASRDRITAPEVQDFIAIMPNVPWFPSSSISFITRAFVAITAPS